MADAERQDAPVVIRVVYDGPPEAGKTTSVRALGASFGRTVYTPEEADGRTVYFDWLEHVGGRFDGAPIHSQIVSVPGQRQWKHRRAHFLAQADVVVFVGDTTTAGWPETLVRLRELRAELDERPGAPVGLVFQANKRDRADALPIDVIRAAAAAARTAVIESVANDDTGVRETFVFAVRLALDRVRDAAQRHEMPPPPVTPTGAELVALLKRLDEPAPAAIVSEGSAAVRASTTITSVRPRPPYADAPSGLVWPPIEGRILLREAAPPPGEPVRVTAVGDCFAGIGTPWRIHSLSEAVFDDVDEGRRALIAWARTHASGAPLLSPRRCLVLGETGDGRWRLWQIVEREPSLRDLATDPSTPLAPAVAERLLAEATAACKAAGVVVGCTMDSVGLGEDARPIYVGLMPWVQTSRR